MQFVSKDHAALRVIEGGRRMPQKTDFTVRLRKEEAMDGPHKLSVEEIECLRQRQPSRD